MLRIPFIAASALAAACTALAWQNSLASLQLTRETFERSITGYIQNNAGQAGAPIYTPGIGRAATQALMAMNDSARAAVVKELGLAAKAFVMSPAFTASYETYLKSSRNAVNHGIVIQDTQKEMEAAAKSGNFAAMEASTNKLMRDAYQKSVRDRLPSIAKMEKQMIDIMADTDASMMDTSMPSTAAEKANVAKAKAMLATAKKQAATDISAARATYKSALMLAAGMASESDAAAGVEADKKREQQMNYNRLALKPALKSQLQGFLATAKSVNFSAQTEMKNGKKVFTSPAFERKDGFWKMLYRLGPGGVNAAIAVAQSWAAEL